MEAQTCSTDVSQVECPSCGANSNLQDLQTDNCLESGQTFECQLCGEEVVIDAVDWEPTIYCSMPDSAARTGRGK